MQSDNILQNFGQHTLFLFAFILYTLICIFLIQFIILLYKCSKLFDKLSTEKIDALVDNQVSSFSNNLENKISDSVLGIISNLTTKFISEE